MAIENDLSSSAKICANAADAAVNRLIALGPRPQNAFASSQWDAQDATLKNKISILNNLSASLSALIITDAMQNVWPALDFLSETATSSAHNIDAIQDVSKAIAAFATVINFGVAVLTLATQPTPGNAGNVATTFKNLLSTI